MSDIALLHVSFADAQEAERVGRAMVEAGLAACVNLLGPCTSIYRWQDSVEQGEEFRALFKTTPELARELADAITRAHSYTLPVIEIWPSAAADGVVQWVRASTGPIRKA